ncbi:glycosyltransferase family 2 protein [Carboxylicivirga caseinilyticus]|uniref:glycosyltransferase family 2 protein n=1 Tax=Carboxylicivirga caseinilyticus TaxID=3417572 RepID=UPI003D34D4E7|nr:glycosyltransferase family 2 protein [Marinilabiliaceae bacterium A049]
MDLVTVAVCTYNSSEYIIETLESIAKQTYMEIELIVSDDASNDNTIDLVEEWLNSEINKHRFIKSQLLKVKKNTGVPANANRALNASNGKWIKYIGADDVLLPSCITDNIYEVTKNTKIKVLFSKLDVFLNTFHESNYLYTTPNEIKQNSILWPQRNSQEQYKMLLISDRVHFTPSVFLHNDTHWWALKTH